MATKITTPSITQPKKGAEIDLKKVSIPGCTLRAPCPVCKKTVKLNYGKGDHFSYSVIGAPFDETLYCYDCDQEITLTVQLDLTVQLISQLRSHGF
jgi:hypothetical protein